MKKIFAITFLLQLFLSASSALAAYQTEVTIPFGAQAGSAPNLIQYVGYLYTFGLGLIGVAALGALVYGGFVYMLSDTITSKDEAKKWIWGAISGLILGLAAYLILYTINADLINWRIPALGN